jgi:hypothetical protein
VKVIYKLSNGQGFAHKLLRCFWSVARFFIDKIITRGGEPCGSWRRVEK